MGFGVTPQKSTTET
ncbi:unnamed protein product, partial [Didymodactylos carnosus]